MGMVRGTGTTTETATWDRRAAETEHDPAGSRRCPGSRGSAGSVHRGTTDDERRGRGSGPRGCFEPPRSKSRAVIPDKSWSSVHNSRSTASTARASRSNGRSRRSDGGTISRWTTSNRPMTPHVGWHVTAGQNNSRDDDILGLHRARTVVKAQTCPGTGPPPGNGQPLDRLQPRNNALRATRPERATDVSRPTSGKSLRDGAIGHV